MTIVKCNVANCEYWEEGNNCNADAILVEIDAHAGNHYDISNEGDLLHQADHKDEAQKSKETCCHTFEPRH